jgi:ribosome biogenesis GTPase / thiamine phosphate phosphatase
MKLSELGITKEISDQIKELDPSEFVAGRVMREHRERYVVSDGENEFDAEITGNLRFTANSRSDFPAVGDWVIFKVFNTDQAYIYRILPRKSVLSRQAVGKFGEEQIIAANIDVAFIVQAINNNFNINRLQRYLTLCYSSDIEPVLIISKIDLSNEQEMGNIILELEKREKKLKYFLLDNISLQGFDQIIEFIQKEKTYCVIGSSGVGKSTFINNLLNKEVLKTGHISKSTNKGRHITEHRELFILENGGLIIDNPGMREVGMIDNPEGIKTTFAEIMDIASGCKFQDCSHLNESGCAVTEAVNNGTIDRDSYENYIRILNEQVRFSTTVEERRRKEKIFGRIMKNYHRDMKKNNT